MLKNIRKSSIGVTVNNNWNEIHKNLFIQMLQIFKIIFILSMLSRYKPAPRVDNLEDFPGDWKHCNILFQNINQYWGPLF